MQTKEERQEYQRKWYQSNKERIAPKHKVYGKIYRDSVKDGLYTVYYLKEEHYVGMTTTIKQRLRKHKSVNNRHIEDVEIIGKYKTKAEALKVEAALHSMGYLGRHKKYKQQTLKQLL
jgi:predicted GIY-YIG superfamily endonuclease